jgi:hypothetical protein
VDLKSIENASSPFGGLIAPMVAPVPVSLAKHSAARRLHTLIQEREQVIQVLYLCGGPHPPNPVVGTSSHRFPEFPDKTGHIRQKPEVLLTHIFSHSVT